MCLHLWSDFFIFLWTRWVNFTWCQLHNSYDRRRIRVSSPVLTAPVLKALLEMPSWRKIRLFCLQACPVTAHSTKTARYKFLFVNCNIAFCFLEKQLQYRGHQIGFFWSGLDLIRIGTNFNYLSHESVKFWKVTSGWHFGIQRWLFKVTQTQFDLYPCRYPKYTASLIQYLIQNPVFAMLSVCLRRALAVDPLWTLIREKVTQP